MQKISLTVYLLIVLLVISVGIVGSIASCKRKTMTDPLSGVAATGARSSGDACTGGGKTASVTLVAGTTEWIPGAEGEQAQVIMTAMAYNACGQKMPDGTMVNWGASVGIVSPAAGATTGGATTTTLTFPLNYSGCSTITASSGDAMATLSACTTPTTPTPGPTATPTTTTAIPTPTPTPVQQLNPCQVINEDNDGDGSLRQVLQDAGTNGCFAITFAAGVSMIRLTTGPLDVLSSLTIDGGASGVTVSGGYQYVVFRVGSGGDITFQNLAITQGTSDGNGGGITIESGGSVTIDTGTTVSDCVAFNGGGIYNDGGTLAINGTIQNNVAGNQGGGIYNTGEVIVTTSGTVSNNESIMNGGGIYNTGTLTVNGTVSNNSSSESGGGIRNEGGTVTLNGTVSGNDTTPGSAGGIYNTGKLLLGSNHLVQGNTSEYSPGGIQNVGGTVDFVDGATCVCYGSGNVPGNGWGDPTYKCPTPCH